MQEKLILAEINSSMTIGGDSKQILDLQGKIDKINENNFKRSADLNKLKQNLERLRCDLHVLLLGKKMARDDSGNNLNNEQDGQEQSTESEKMVYD